jgi:four helix bundle protein
MDTARYKLNVREALQAQSKRDFLSKIGIALKEANEALYWIELLRATDYIAENQKASIWNDCNELVSLLVAITKTTKSNLDAERSEKNAGK